MMLRIFLFIFLTSPCVISYANSKFTWSDSVCDKEHKVFQGATRDFYNRGGFLSWENKMGDWYDKNHTLQGARPYAVITNVDNTDELRADVTDLVKDWHSKLIPNHGFYLKPNSKSRNQGFYTREHKDRLKQPRLVIKYGSEILIVHPSKDTVLKNTYSCLGQMDKSHTNQVNLIAFDYKKLTGDIKYAYLSVYVDEPSKKLNEIEIFATRIPTKNIVLSDAPRRAVNSKNAYYYTGFENENWNGLWTTDSKGFYYVVQPENLKNRFQAIKGNALAVVVEKNKHVGINARLALKQFSQFKKAGQKHVYFQYYLRFSSDWQPSDVGKLPGFGGRYGQEPFRAGWGGRRSNGQNGWSARGRFEKVIRAPNPLENSIPVGTYLYHTNQKSTYGDFFFWEESNNFVLQKEKWYRIEQYIRINDKGVDNGKFISWVDGVLAYQASDINYSNHPEIGIEDIWLTVYHGGKKKAPKDMTIFIDELRVSNHYIGNKLHKQ